MNIRAKSGGQLAVASALPLEAVDIPAPDPSVAEFDPWTEFLSVLPQSWEDWIALIVITCALLSVLLPAPSRSAPRAWQVCHKIICALGLGAGKLTGRARAGVAARLGSIIRRRK